MTYMCKKCGRTITHEDFWATKVSWEMAMPGLEAPWRPRPEGYPIPLPACPYCGHSEEKDGDNWFYKNCELKHTWRDAVRHQRNAGGR